MKITLIAAGKIKDRMIANKTAEYLKRLGKGVKLEFKEVEDIPDSIEKESEKLLAGVPSRARVIALDERGRLLDSRGFAKIISDAISAGADLAFILGGPAGLHQSVRNSADDVVAFSRLTLPHELARLILVEQIYRAFTILRNEPYHK